MEASWHRIISGSNQRPVARLIRAACGIVAWPYGRAVAARNRLFDAGMLRAHQVDVPVISIGNLTLGGTGKTPMVEFVCRWFLQRGKRPIILSRGYRAAGGCNDEARLLQSNLPEVPHLQGKDRVALARHACEHFAPDVLVLDDGFQHRRLARDLDIVLIDCTEPFGYGRIFPRGLLREPIGSLRRAGLVVLSRADQCLRADRDRIRAQIFDAAGEKPIVEAVHRPTALRSGWLGLSPRSPGRGIEDSATATRPLDDLRGRPVAAFCAIGNPAAFWHTLDALGCQLIATRAFRDHHSYSPADLADLQIWAAQLRPHVVVTTQKDMVKIPATAWHDPPLFALQIEAVVTDSDRHLDRALAGVFVESPPVTQAA